MAPVAPVAPFNPGMPLAPGAPLATADPTALVAPGIPTPRAPALRSYKQKSYSLISLIHAE